MVGAYAAVVAAVAMGRGAELVVSSRNVRRARTRGGVEVGAGLYPFMVALHAAFLAACPLEVWLFNRPWLPAVGVPMIAVLGVAVGLRTWAMWTLGERWNTRVICVPGDALVTSGPYRWLHHPNYAAVIMEFVALPLVHTAYLTAVVFSTLNAIVLTARIRVEDRALATYCVSPEAS